MKLIEEVAATHESLKTLEMTSVSTGQELMNLRARFLFTAFAFMAGAEMIRSSTERFANASQEMENAFAEIEYQAVAASTVMRGTAEVADELSDAMLRYGRETEYTAVEAGEAMEVLGRAGLGVEESIGATAAVLDMARANNMEVAETARFAAGMYRGWNLEGQELTQELVEMNGVIDEQEAVTQNLTMATASVTHAAREARTTAQELANAMRFATAAAQTVGWEMEEVAAGMMAAADRMIEAGMAGRSFRRVMSRIGMVAGDTGRGIQQARDLVAEYGIQLSDSEGEMVGFIDLVEQLEDATDRLTTTQEINLYQQLAGMRGMNALAGAVEEGAEELRKNEWELRASAAAAGLYEAGVRDVREEMVEWRKELERHGTSLDEVKIDLEHFTEEVGVTSEVALKLNEVLTDSTIATEDLADELENITIVSEMVDDRLDTLQGSIILLESSLEAMWASLAEGFYKEIMQMWYDALKEIADIIAELPEWLRFTIAYFVMMGNIIHKTIPPMIMFVGMIYIIRAALASLRLEQYEMMKAQINRMKLISGEEQAMHKRLTTLLYNSKAEKDATMATKWHNMSLKEKKAWLERNTDATWRQILAKQADINLTQKQTVSTEALKFSIVQLSIAMFASMGAMMALAYAWRTGSDLAYALGFALVVLAGYMAYLRISAMNLEGSLWSMITAKSTLIIKTATLMGLVFVLIYLFMRLEGATKAWVGAGIFAAGVLTLLIIKMIGLQKASGGLIYAIGMLAAGIALLIDYLFNITDRITETERAIEGNSLVPALYNLAEVFRIVGRVIKWILGLFTPLVDAIDWVKDKLGGLGDFTMDLIGNSLIPEAFEAGIDRIMILFKIFNELLDAEKDELLDFYEYVNKIMGNSLIPEAFERGTERIRRAMEGLHSDIGLQEGFAGVENRFFYEQPQILVDLSDFTSKEEVDPEEIVHYVQEGVEEGFKKYSRQLERG